MVEVPEKKKKKRKRKNEDPMAGNIVSLERYKQHIDRMPLVTSGETVGLGPNATFEYSRLALKNTTRNLNSILFRPRLVSRNVSISSMISVLGEVDKLPMRLKQ